jgi:hypothetical protein
LQEIDDQLRVMSRQMERIAAAAGAVPRETVLADTGSGITRIGDTFIVMVDDAAPSRLAREMRLMMEERRGDTFS